MKRKLSSILFFIICIFSFKVVYAEDLTVIEDATGNLHDALEEVDAQIIKERFTLDYVYENGDYTFPDSFSFNVAKKYENNEDILANFEEDKANGTVSYGTDTKFFGRVITYNDNIAKNDIATPDGTIKLKFKNAVIFSDETYGDLYLEISNFKIENGYKDTTKPIAIMSNDMAMISYFALQELSATAAVNNSDKVPSYKIGMAYDVYLYVKKNNEIFDGKMGYIFSDADQQDQINSGYLDSSGNILPYAESVILKSGVIDNKVHVRSNNYLNIGDTSSGVNTRFAGSRITNDNNMYLAGFAVLISTQGFRYGWTSPAAGTYIGLLGTFNIETNTIGDNKTKVSITQSDDKILWKSSKTITITPNDGYFVNEIIIDGEVVDYQSLELVDNKRVYTKDDISYTFYENNGEVKYTFNSIIDDHSLSASVDAKIFTINTEVENGTIDSSIDVIKNSSIEINYKPLDGFGINKLIVDGKEYSVKEINKNKWHNSYKFDNVGSDHNIKVIYTEIENPKTGIYVKISLFILIDLIIGGTYYLIKKRNYLSKIS